MYALNDKQELEKICGDVLKDNAKQKDRYKSNPKKALEHLHNAACKKYHGRIHDDLVHETFKRLLEKE